MTRDLRGPRGPGWIATDPMTLTAQEKRLRVGILSRLCCASSRSFDPSEPAVCCKPSRESILTGSMIDNQIHCRNGDEHRALTECIACFLSYRKNSARDLPEIEDDQREFLQSYMQPSVLGSVTPSGEPIDLTVAVAAPKDLVLDLIWMFHPKPVPQLLFDRLTSHRRHWGEDGELESLELSSPEPTTRLYRDRTKMNRAIEILCSTNTIKPVPAPMNKRAYQVSNASTDHNSSSISWKHILQLLSHAFPGYHDEIGSVRYR
jgi:hypothetical protein